MTKFLAIDHLPTQWTNDTLATLLSRFSGVRRSQVMANKDNRPLGFAIVEVAHSRQREDIIQALDGWVVGSHSIRVSRLDRSTY
jgi:RNA recognition motif-containing protein